MGRMTASFMVRGIYRRGSSGDLSTSATELGKPPENP